MVIKKLLYGKGHGDENGVWDDRQLGRNAEAGPQLSPSELANLIRDNGWEPGEPISLYSCNTGDEDYHQRLADEMNASVTAPDGYLYSPGFGEYWPSHIPFYQFLLMVQVMLPRIPVGRIKSIFSLII